MAVYDLPPFEKRIDVTAWVAPSASVIGAVVIGRNVSVWFGAVIRGDDERIEVADLSNVQDGAVLHSDPGFPVRIGRSVSVDHQAMLHGCEIGDASMIGIQAVVMNGAKIGRNSIVGAGSLVTERKVYPDNVIILGRPAKVVRNVTPDEIQTLKSNAEDYVRRALSYMRSGPHFRLQT